MSRCVAGGPYKNMGCCYTVVHYVQFTEKKVRTGITLLVAMEKGGFNKCRMTDGFLVFEFRYFSAADDETWFIRYVFCCFGMEFLCDVSVRVAQLRYFSFYGRSVVVGCGAAGVVEQIF